MTNVHKNRRKFGCHVRLFSAATCASQCKFSTCQLTLSRPLAARPRAMNAGRMASRELRRLCLAVHFALQYMFINRGFRFYFRMRFTYFNVRVSTTCSATSVTGPGKWIGCPGPPWLFRAAKAAPNKWLLPSFIVSILL